MNPQIPIDRERIEEFSRRWRVIELSLFGSVLTPDFGPSSDIDVLVRFDPAAQWSLWDLVTMRDELTALFNRDVDLVEEDALRNPFRKHSILSSKQILYAA